MDGLGRVAADLPRTFAFSLAGALELTARRCASLVAGPLAPFESQSEGRDPMASDAFPYFANFIGNQAVGFPVNRLCCLLVGGVDEAEDGPGAFVTPIFVDLDPVFRLHLVVSLVRSSL